MKLRNLIFYLCLLSVCLQPAVCASWSPDLGQPYITNFSTADYRTDWPNWAAIQDEKGIMYFGNNVILEYDGIHWQQIPVPGSGWVRGLAIDKKGQIWVGADGEIGYLEEDLYGVKHYVSLLNKVPSEYQDFGEIWYVFATDFGIVFIATRHVFLWADNHIKAWQLDVPRRLFAHYVKNQLYIHQVGVGLKRFDDNELKLVCDDSQFDKYGIMFMLPWSDDNILMGTSKGLYALRDGNPETMNTGIDDYLFEHVLICGVRLSDGNIALGTLYGGVIIASPEGELIRIIDETTGLKDQSIHGIFQDKDQNIWNITNTGISLIEWNTPVRILNKANGLTGQPIRSICHFRDKLTIATDDGVFFLESSKGTQNSPQFVPSHMLSDAQWDLLNHDSGLLVSGIYRVNLYKNDKITTAFESGNDIFCMFQSRLEPNRIYLGEMQKLDSIYFDEGIWKNERTFTGISDVVLSIAEAENGDIWVGTPSGGTYRIINPQVDHDGRIFNYSGTKGLPKNQGAVTVITHNGKVLLFTNLGVYEFLENTETFIRVSSLELIFNDHYRPTVYSNTSAELPNPWVVRKNITNSYEQIGLFYTDEHGNFQWQLLPLKELTHIGRVRALYQHRDGKDTILTLGGTNTILMVNVTNFPRETKPSQPLIRRINKGIIPVALKQPDGLKSFEYSKEPISIQFASPHFEAESPILYQTKLRGYEETWSNPSTDSSREYHNLWEGNYTFQVRAVNIHEETSEETAYRFWIAPPWYRNKAAYLLYAILGGGLVLGIVHIRSRQLVIRSSRLEALVKKRTDELERANQVKSEFVANMSHEIRNPLNGVIGLIELLSEKETPPKETLNALKQCSHYLNTLVKEILDFSKIEAGKILLEEEAFNPKDLLDSISILFVKQATDKSLKISSTFYSSTSSNPIGDKVKIQQILVNLVGNAIKFTLEGSIQIGLNWNAIDEDKGVLKFWVKDTGVGIPRNDQFKIYDEFYQGSKSRGHGLVGTGLGLTVCKAYVEKMNGKIFMTSENNQGSTFTVTIPLSMSNVTIFPESQPREMELISELKVLVVEDLDYNQMVLKGILRRFGCRVDCVSDGQEALEILDRKSFDIVFMDWDLPKLNGVETTKIFRRGSCYQKNIPVIGMSAYATVDKKKECMQAGMDDFIAKPLTPENLYNIIQQKVGEDECGKLSVPGLSLSSSSDINLTSIIYLADGNSAELSKLVDIFIKTLYEIISKLNDAIDNEHSKLTRFLAHQALSHSSLVSSKNVGEPLSRILKAARANNVKIPKTQIRVLNVEAERLANKMRENIDVMSTK